MSLLRLDDLTARVRRKCKSGNDPDRYQVEDIHDGILEIGNDFVNRTRCVRAKDQVALSEDQFALDFSLIGGFLPPLIIDACTKAGRDGRAVPVLSGDGIASITVIDGGVYDSANPPTATVTIGTGSTLTVHMTGSVITSITRVGVGSGYTADSVVTITRDPADAPKEHSLDLPDLDSVRDIRNWSTASSGCPRRMVFTTLVDAILDHPVNFDGCVQIIWTPNFSVFDPGDNTDPELNIPDNLLIPCIKRMAVAVQSNDMEAVERGEWIKEYEAHVMRSMGAGGLGAKVIERESRESRRRWERW